jgi:hypothetical protein
LYEEICLILKLKRPNNRLLSVIIIAPYITQIIIAYLKYGKAKAIHMSLAKIQALAQSAFTLWLLCISPI